jgi:hypothetical protein
MILAMTPGKYAAPRRRPMLPAAHDDCPMTAECPGYDRDRRRCLFRPGDCEFAPEAADNAAAQADDRTVWEARDPDGPSGAG